MCQKAFQKRFMMYFKSMAQNDVSNWNTSTREDYTTATGHKDHVVNISHSTWQKIQQATSKTHNILENNSM